MLVTALMMVVAFPPLILGSILLETGGAPSACRFFEPQAAAMPIALLWQHLFWLFGPSRRLHHLPADGRALSTIIPVFAKPALVGYRAIVVAIIALPSLSFGIWVTTCSTVASPISPRFFSAALGDRRRCRRSVQIFAWLATLRAWPAADGTSDAPTSLASFFIFAWRLTGVMLAIVPFN